MIGACRPVALSALAQKGSTERVSGSTGAVLKGGVQTCIEGVMTISHKMPTRKVLGRLWAQ